MFKYRMILVIAVAALIALPAMNLQAETIGYWQFEEQAAGTQTTGAADELIDSSGNGHHGYANGSTLPSYVAADSGFDPDTGITLTGNDDKLVVPGDDVFNMRFSDPGDWVIEMDIKAGTYQSSNATLFTKKGAGVGYYLRLNGSKLQMMLQNDLNWNGSTTMFSATSLNDDTWHNIKVAIHADADADLSSVTYYIDGAQDGFFLLKDVMTAGAAGSWNNQDIVNSEDLWMGEYFGTTKSFRGDISMAKFSYTPVPEPSTLALLATGLIGLLAYAWQKRK